MSRYVINCNFAHWKKGDIVEEYIYGKFPVDIKSKCTKYVEPVKVEEVKTVPAVEVVSVREPDVTDKPTRFQKRVSE